MKSCYHIEYELLPGTAETTQVDLVVYGPVAKLCREEESQARYENRKVFSLQEDEACGVNGCVKTMVNKIRACIEKKSKTSVKIPFFQSKSELGSEIDKNTGLLNSDLHKLDIFELEEIRKPGSVSVEISPVPLLAGDTVNEHFPVRSAGVAEVLCNISLDKPLMSDQLKAELNPLVLTILSATSLPSSPVPFHILQEECLPVYCQYKFHNLKPHRTNYHKQGADIYFRDVNVIMTGLMSSADVQQFLCGPPLEIEVHDRDRKLAKEPTLENMNTHGVACLNLSELLLGEKSLELHLPIKRCRPMDRAEQRRRQAAGSRALLPQGHYYENNSQLKVKIDIACPLNIKSLHSVVGPSLGPFGRIIYLFSGDNSSMVKKLRSEILQINAAAFHLGCCSLESIETALSNHAMNFRPDGSENVDFVSGFHLQDKKIHVFVLEGLKDKAVRSLWETCPMKLSEKEEEQVTVHYDSGLGFFTRLYGSLDLCLGPIQLRKPLASIMRTPRVHVRGAVPPACYQALSRLSQLCDVRLLHEAVQCDLFPSAAMILSMSKEFGIRARQCEQSAAADTTGDTPGDCGGDGSVRRVRVKRLPPLSTTNSEYVSQRQSRQRKQRNFIQENMKNVQERRPKKDARFLRVDVPADQAVHNYSIQTFNFHRTAKELLQKEMAKMPGRRFTYSQQYHSATVEPGPTTPEPRRGSTAWLSGVDRPRAQPARGPSLAGLWRASTRSPGCYGI
ncbi:uncharacterized protein cfap92 [Salarias fasciatus]|uniref:uncharacterized protein cfap92 n=1 Tax=Salarias fasciatus TaxID=181472 RepID=UPI0011767D23|nr:uncharacterized protein KIAA1257 homolog [Salarias fasciatus]